MIYKAFVFSDKRGFGKQSLCLIAAGCSLVCSVSVAQQQQSGEAPDAPSVSTQSQTAPSASTQPQTASQGTNPLASGVEFALLLERKSLVFPDLATNKGRLDSWGKFKLAANNSVSLATIGSSLIGGAYGQATDSPSGYGQGGSGYAKRFGSDMARAASDNMFGTFLLASVLHQDPRFYVRKNLTFKETVKYSAVRLVQTRSDSGKRVVNYSGLLGPLAGEALANAYWPEENRGVGSTLVRYAADIGWKFGGNMLRQYWPQINRKLRLAPSETEPEPPASDKP
jgi:hypothetical protein